MRGGGAELGLLAALARERLDHADAGQVFLQDRVQGRQPLLDPGEHRPAQAAEQAEDDDRHRQDPQRDQRQPGIRSEQQDERPRKEHDRADELDQALTYEEADLLDVVGGADHQLPGLVAIVVGERQTLNFGEQIIAHVVGNGLRVAFAPVGLQEGEHTAQGGENHDDDAGLQDRTRSLGLVGEQLGSQLLQRPRRRILESLQDSRECLR